MGLFLDESALEKKNTSGLHFLPDVYVRVVQMEPKLILQVIEYDKLAEALKTDSDSIRPEDFGDQDVAEFERVRR